MVLVRIALISYEFPPDTADGGIATYVDQSARMLHECGHDVVVFCGSRVANAQTDVSGILVIRIRCDDPQEFGDKIVAKFSAYHGQKPFDVVEGPDYGADTRHIKRLFPDLPLVVKLHTPMRLVRELTPSEISTREKAWWYFKSLARMRRPTWGATPWSSIYYREKDEAERQNALSADLLVAPCRYMVDKVSTMWKLDAEKIDVVPYPYQPESRFLAIPPGGETRRVTYFGRLEAIKGVDVLARVIPRAVARYPDWRFRFCGMNSVSAIPGLDMKSYMEPLLKDVTKHVEILPPIPLADIPKLLEQTDIVVIPSRWDNFPNTCLESMAAARAIVGTAAGGMQDMLANGAGLLVSPDDTTNLEDALCHLIENTELRERIGRIARQRVLSCYDYFSIVRDQLASYDKAIKLCRSQHPVANRFNDE